MNRTENRRSRQRSRRPQVCEVCERKDCPYTSHVMFIASARAHARRTARPRLPRQMIGGRDVL